MCCMSWPNGSTPRPLRLSAADSLQSSEEDAASRLHVPHTPLEGYEIVEVTIRPGSPALDRRIGEVPWPTGSIVVAATEERELVTPRSGIELRAGERVILLAPTSESGRHHDQ